MPLLRGGRPAWNSGRVAGETAAGGIEQCSDMIPPRELETHRACSRHQRCARRPTTAYTERWRLARAATVNPRRRRMQQRAVHATTRTETSPPGWDGAVGSVEDLPEGVLAADLAISELEEVATTDLNAIP